jgi:hypothetical protein
MEIPGIGEKMVDKIYQAVNRFYEGGAEAAAPAPTGENTDDVTVESEATPREGEASAESAPVGAESSEGAAGQQTPVETAAEDERAAEVAVEERPTVQHSEGGAKAEEEPKP